MPKAPDQFDQEAALYEERSPYLISDDLKSRFSSRFHGRLEKLGNTEEALRESILADLLDLKHSQ